jgi:hypothetical protein
MILKRERMSEIEDSQGELIRQKRIKRWREIWKSNVDKNPQGSTGIKAEEAGLNKPHPQP